MRTTYITIASLFCIIAVTVFAASSVFISGDNKLNCAENLKEAKQIESKHFDFKGVWYPIKWESSDIAGLSEEDIKSMMKLNVHLDDNMVVFFGDSTRSPQYDFHKEGTFNFINNNYKIDAKILGITKDSLEILTVKFKSSEPTPPYDLIILDDKMLVNIDGIFFFLKKQPKDRELFLKEFNGTGNFKQKINLKSCNATIKIDYNFFTVADKIILEDADGNILFSTEMESTKGIKSITKAIQLTAREQCFFYLKVESSPKEKSKWELKVTLSEY